MSGAFYESLMTFEEQARTADKEIGDADWSDKTDRVRQIKRLIADVSNVSVMSNIERVCLIALANDIRPKGWIQLIQTGLLALILWRVW